MALACRRGNGTQSSSLRLVSGSSRARSLSRPVVEAIRDAESHTGRAINASVYPPGEFQAKLTGGHHFLNSVMKREKLFVVGSEDELGAVLEEQLDSET